MTDQPDTPQTPLKKAFSPVAAEPPQSAPKPTPAEEVDATLKACRERANCLRKSSAIRNGS